MNDMNFWTVIFAAGAFGVALTGTISGFVYLVMKLITEPMKQDIAETKEMIIPMLSKVKSEDELRRIARDEIRIQEDRCREHFQSMRNTTTTTIPVPAPAKGGN